MAIPLLQARCDAHILGIEETVGPRTVFWSFLSSFLPLSSSAHSLPVRPPPPARLPLPPTSTLSIRGSLEKDTDVSVKSYAFNSSRYNFKMYLNNKYWLYDCMNKALCRNICLCESLAFQKSI